MKLLILNSGIGHRMGSLTAKKPKCMLEISDTDTILSYQLKAIAAHAIKEVVITTGLFDDMLANYCKSLDLPLHYTFVNNSLYDKTNYIYSIYCAREYLKDDDIIMMHGDIVFEETVFYDLLKNQKSCMVVSSKQNLSNKDFKAITKDNKIIKIGTDYYTDAISAQPLYKLRQTDWLLWLKAICEFVENGNSSCYAEDAFNQISNQCNIYALDIKEALCQEIDTAEDLSVVSKKLHQVSQKTVYMCFSTDVIHSGHISIIQKAERLGKLIIGVLSDEAIVSYKRFPLIPFDERKSLFENIKGVSKVVEQSTLSYITILRALKPSYVVHGDDWKEGFQRPIRDEVVSVLAEYGGQLIEYPYTKDEKYDKIENEYRLQLSMPEMRRSRLHKLLSIKPCVSIIEAHNGITGLIAEKTVVYDNGKSYQFDGIWVSSLCDSTAKGKPDIELVDMSSRLRTIDDIMEVTTKPIILDGDTGGLTEHFVFNVKTLERIGVSAIIIEDKIGLKRNSLFGNDVEQTQDSIESFSSKISAGKKAQKTKEFMIIARIESLILEKGIDDALLRAKAYTEAGADGIMIHSRKRDPTEIFEFVERFRERDASTPIVVVPTSFNTVTEDEFAKRGVNIVIYANHLIRSAFPAMQKAAQTILKYHRAKEADDLCMPINEILTLIPEE